MSALHASALTVRYGSVVAVQTLDLTVAPGQLVAVTGPSGAGKTSLLAALAGVLRPASGTVTIDAEALKERDDAVRRGIVLIPQGHSLVRMLTALENVAVPLLARSRRRHVQDAAREALTSVGLGEALDQLVDELSGGQQQRLAIARGLAERGSVVLADEPTSELDAANRGVVMRLLRAEAERGAAVVVATHDPEAAVLCNAELHLDEGHSEWVRDERANAVTPAR